MSALAITTTPVRQARPAATGPRAQRPRNAGHGPSRQQPASCRVVRPMAAEPVWRLTSRGMAVAMTAVGLVMGSGVATIVAAFLSVSNAPL